MTLCDTGGVYLIDMLLGKDITPYFYGHVKPAGHFGPHVRSRVTPACQCVPPSCYHHSVAFRTPSSRVACALLFLRAIVLLSRYGTFCTLSLWLQRHSREAMRSLQQHFVGMIDNEESSADDSDSGGETNEFGDSARTVIQADGTIVRLRRSVGGMVQWLVVANDEQPGGIYKIQVASVAGQEVQPPPAQWTIGSMGMHLYVQCDVGSRPYSLTRVPGEFMRNVCIISAVGPLAPIARDR